MHIEFYKHSLHDDDIKNAIKVLRSVFITAGPVCAEFEKKFSDFTSVGYTITLNSCTAAIHLALQALGIGPGSEVITTPMTFIATATSILQSGAKPVFVDIEMETGLMDPNLVEASITPRTKAILPVHLYGTMTDMRALRTIADQYDLFLIEDAAHCIEGERDGIHPGQVSDAVCYSFYATKNLTCGEGGALATNKRELAEKVRMLRQHGMSKEANDRHHGLYEHWDMLALGWKYNLDDIRASLLLDQLDRLSDQWEKRHQIYKKYCALLEGQESIRIPQIHGKCAHHLFTILVPSGMRDRLLQYLGEQGIGVAVNYRAIHTLTWFKEHLGYRPDDFPNAKAFGERTISLPFYPSLGDGLIETVVDSVKACLSEVDS
jgi:dTDP-4-amino-4,6-dideoxygalactose transaminase